MNRADLMRSVLKDGGWHTRRDVFERVGFMLTNNAASELRGRGFTVEHKREGRIDFYRLLDRAEGTKAGHQTTRGGSSRIALRSVEQVALPTAGKPLPQRAACSPIQLELTVAA